MFGMKINAKQTKILKTRNEDDAIATIKIDNEEGIQIPKSPYNGDERVVRETKWQSRTFIKDVFRQPQDGKP